MQDFLETPRFPTTISIGSAGGPGFKTFVFTGASGVEGATLQWDQARARYQIEQTNLSEADMNTIRNLFYACRGRAVGFRFKDWADYTFTDENIGTGDGVTRVFYLKKAYGSYSRRLFKPVSGTVTVKINGTPNAATIDTTLGTVTFTVPDTPPAAAVITASGQFDVPVRFDTDAMEVSFDGYDLRTWKNLGLVEIKFVDA
jgi:uncharacterized protein (TIGR02217 family)